MVLTTKIDGPAGCNSVKVALVCAIQHRARVPIRPIILREQDERERVGWFPLNRRSSRLMHLAAGDKIAGSVQLRVRWVHSVKAFLNCRIQALDVSVWRAYARPTYMLYFGGEGQLLISGSRSRHDIPAHALLHINIISCTWFARGALSSPHFVILCLRGTPHVRLPP